MNYGHQTLATRPSHAQGAPSEVAGANLVKLLRYARRGVGCPAPGLCVRGPSGARPGRVRTAASAGRRAPGSEPAACRGPFACKS